MGAGGEVFFADCDKERRIRILERTHVRLTREREMPTVMARRGSMLRETDAMSNAPLSLVINKTSSSTPQSMEALGCGGARFCKELYFVSVEGHSHV